MRIHRLWIPIIVALLASDATARDEDGVPIEEVIVLSQSAQLKPFVDYCSEQLPEHRQDFEGAFDSFVGHLRAISKEVAAIAREVDGRDVSPDEVEATMDQIKQAADGVLLTMSQSPPEPVCSRILAKLQSATVENLRELMNASLADYQARRGGNAGSRQ